jgi:hypothetical protein
MPGAPRWPARANKVGLNRLTAFIPPWAPGRESCEEP